MGAPDEANPLYYPSLSVSLTALAPYLITHLRAGRGESAAY